MTSASSKPSSPRRAKARADSPPTSDADARKGDRIAKVLARAGVCSRREAERWIAEGRVAVDNVVLTTPAFLVTEKSMIVVDGKPIQDTEPTRVWRYHKPIGLLTTHNDPQGRTTVFDTLPPALGRVISVGRLDYNSEGLLLLTNDGGLARRLEMPSTAWTRRYRVRVHGRPTDEELAKLKRGIEIDGVRYGSIEAELDRQQGANAWVTLALNEGKNREIRKVMEHLGWPVTRLIRVAYGPFQLGNLQAGMVEEVTGRVLTDQLGLPARESRAKQNANRRRPS
ncbi:MAG: pseudouridine synthase [Rhodospirillales bacterium]|jgi:23S rRNA pseudouridine2605 synthase|nr:pseudouridine synthase [Rhodospirillales bacterium]